jgi:sugar lactone lactonase YvrE
MSDQTSNPVSLCDDGNLCGEGPLWDASCQKLFWTDCVGRKFYVFDSNTGERKVLLLDFEVNGCVLDSSGGLVFVNNFGVWFWDHKHAPQHLFSEHNGTVLQLNDCIADPRGRLIAGSAYYNPEKSYELGKLLSFESRSIRVLDEGFHLANGLGFSCDGQGLYFADSITRTVYVYRYHSESGEVSDRHVFAKLDSTAGLPDGLTVDAEDHVWIAEWYGGRISRYTPEGRLERQLEVPAKQTSSLTFGGPNLRDIYITSAAKSEAMPVMPPGYDPVSGYFGGALFRIRQNIQGKPEHRTELV